MLPDLPTRPVLIVHGMPYDRDQGQAVSPARIDAPNSRARPSDVHGGGSQRAILVDAQSMAGCQMPSDFSSEFSIDCLNRKRVRTYPFFGDFHFKGHKVLTASAAVSPTPARN